MKLNLGCGEDILPDYINVDSNDSCGANIIADLAIIPWNFESNSAEVIRMIDVLEHLPDTVSVLNECHRILIPNGELVIRVPNVLTCPENAFTDPTHVKYFTHRSFEYWDPTSDYGIKYGYYLKNKYYIVRKDIDININITLKKLETV